MAYRPQGFISDAHLKNFSLILNGQDCRMALVYDLLNTCLHAGGDDLGLDGGLSPNIEKSDMFDKTGHPCRVDFDRFGVKIGLVKKRLDKILNKYVSFPKGATNLIARSYLPDKAKCNYTSIVNERISRFIREAE